MPRFSELVVLELIGHLNAWYYFPPLLWIQLRYFRCENLIPCRVNVVKSAWNVNFFWKKGYFPSDTVGEVSEVSTEKFLMKINEETWNCCWPSVRTLTWQWESSVQSDALPQGKQPSTAFLMLWRNIFITKLLIWVLSL